MDTYQTYDESSYKNIGTLFIHIVFTLGIWVFIWVYKFVKLTNIPNEKYRKPFVVVLICIFFPFMYFVAIYEIARRVDNIANFHGLESDLSGVCLILAIFIPIIPPLLIQGKMNEIVIEHCTQSTKMQPASSSNCAIEIAEEINKYKKLFESNLITKEEFEAKKKQILEL